MNKDITYSGLIRDLRASEDSYASMGILALMSRIFCDAGASTTFSLIIEFCVKYNVMQTSKMIFEKYIRLNERESTKFYAVINSEVRLTNSNSPKSFYAESKDEAVKFCTENNIF
jgi:hypothetical protein